MGRISLTQLLLRYDDRDAPPMPPRPRTRAECLDGPRPCPWVGCRHHLCAPHSANAQTWWAAAGRLRDDEVADYLVAAEGPTCSLDVAEEGEHTLEQCAALLGVSRERVRQLEEDALASMAAELASALPRP